MTSRTHSRSCRTASIRSGRAGGLAGELDGKVVSSEKLERTVLLSLLLGQRFFIGTGGPSPVDDRDYHGPFKFTGKINKVFMAFLLPRIQL